MRSLQDLMNLKGRVALITGGAGQIGAALGAALAELGAAIAVLDLQQDGCGQVCQQLHDTYNIETLPLVVDLADAPAVRAVPDAVLARFGRLDILINCAALVGTSALKGWGTPFLDQNADTWRLALEVNLTAAFVLTQACTPALKESRHGSIINFSSIYGVVGPDMSLYEGTAMGNPAAYAVSKGGILQFTRWLAAVLAPHIRVNAITPGGVWRDQAEQFHQRYVARTPLRRMATEEDLKGATAYLASDLSAYVTGHNLIVDGGWTAW
ncbi:MAG: SDR family oxidoreductase [Anaerolineae bacterium]|nr:SDR family oxidoreductase [Anaerolineae bacterium]